MSAATLRHVVENAWARLGDEFGAWFPAAFDWQTLCADAPAMALRVAAGDGGDEAVAEVEDGLVPELDLVEAAERVFARAYVGALVGVAVAVEDERDPDLLVARLAEPLTDEEEPRFSDLAARSLERVERALAGRLETPEDESPEALASLLVEGAWPGVETALEGLPGFGDEEAPELPTPVQQVLAGVARVAAILAAFRWLTLADPG